MAPTSTQLIIESIQIDNRLNRFGLKIPLRIWSGVAETMGDLRDGVVGQIGSSKGDEGEI